MANPDPTNEFMYQLPVEGAGKKSVSEGGRGDGDGTMLMKQSQPLDLEALNERLQTLGLGHTAPPPNPHQPSQPQQQNYLPSKRASQAPFASSSQNQYLQPWHQYPSVTELAPNDSISMYRPARAPSASIRSGRRGGTNVDPGETDMAQDYDEGRFDQNDDDRRQEADAASYWTHDNMSYATPRTGARLEDEMTVGPTSVWTRGDMGRNMYDMRDRLLDAEATRNQEQMTELRRQIKEAQDLATATTRLEAAEKQLRELQARLIAEQVARTQIEQEVERREDETKNYQTEWASAVRALRRARDEGKKSEEEKRRIQRCFEEARDKLWKYHEALRVREARAQGKEEGRAEAWQEAERWMGGSPPIPGVDPVQAVPGAVLHQTPMIGVQSPPKLQSPTVQQFQQPQQPPQRQEQASQPHSSPPQVPLQSIAQLMEYFANNPSVFPQFNQPQPQQVSPPQDGPLGPSPHQTLQSQSVSPPHQMPTTRESPASPQQQQPQYPGHALTQHSIPAQATNQYMMPSHPQPTVPPQGLSMMQSQFPGAPPPGPQMQTQQMGQEMPQPMMVPVMVPVAPPVNLGAAAGLGAMPQSQMPNVGGHPYQMPPTTSGAPSQQQATKPHQAATGMHAHTNRTPRTHAATMKASPRRTQPPTSSRTQATALPHAGQTATSAGVNAAIPESTLRPHAAESYLERVDHDPSLKRMMAGAPTKTIHTSAVPHTEAGTRDTRPPTANQSHYDNGGSVFDKPLPNPAAYQGSGNRLSRAQTTKGPSRTGPNTMEDRSGLGRRMSVGENVQPNSRQRPMSQIPDGDRYPIFPMKGKEHSRQSSYGSIDPAAIGLPISRDVSAVQSPNSQYRGGRRASHPTPQRSVRTPARSRVAGALRNDEELDQPGLENIEEAAEEDLTRHMGGQHGSVPPPMMGSNQMPPPHIMRQMQQAHAQGYGPGLAGRGPPRPAPSMPNMRHRITPVMPQPLGSFGGPPNDQTQESGANKTFSEPHHHRREDRGHQHHHSLSALFGGRRQQDPVMRRNDELPEPENAYRPPRTHDLFVPPGMAPAAVSGSVMDVQGPRTSALGLSGIGGNADSDDDGRSGGRMRAPTSSHSRSNHPPSAIFPNQVSPTASPKHVAPPPERAQPPPGEVIDLNAPPEPGKKRETIIITERFNSPPTKTQPQAHEAPLPPPRSMVPTAYTATSLPHHDATGRKAQIIGKQAHDIPLPPTRSVAPTAYTASPPEQVPTVPMGTAPEVKAIDFATMVPLPQSRATTWYDRRTTVTSEPDIEEPRPARSVNKQVPASKASKVLRKPVPHSGNGVDPRSYPLPPSRAPTRGRASTYAASVPPIEEVTEPESGRENLIRRTQASSKVY
ncbi:hypothetical protein CI109_100325 [Kwoniella shandongensis]|uniref:Uncharacterized protein n=1 Tax=Kwoniella shandongensis TaxID=1734106 RepID=A0AAJ8LCI7_9TREE